MSAPKPNEMQIAAQSEFVTFSVMDQTFGIPVLQVREVSLAPTLARIPLAPPEIAGSINLRGRIVTAVDMRRRLGLPPSDRPGMSLVVDYQNELYSLIIDRAGDVISLNADECENNPATLDPRWKNVATGIYRLRDRLLVMLDIPSLLRLDPSDQLKSA